MTATALNNLWTYIKSLDLSQDNRKWLSERLVEPVSQVEQYGQAGVMPCTFTEEEWQEEVALSLQEGVATMDEVNEYLEKWNVAS